MGSPTEPNANPQLPMDNKPIKTVFSIFKKVLKNKKKEPKNEKPTKEEKSKVNDVTEVKNENELAVANILKTFENLDIKVESKQKEKEVIDRKDSTDDEFSQFNFKVIEEDRKRHSSEDSGYSETKEESKDQEVLESFGKLTIEDDEEKEDEDKEEKEEDRDKKKSLHKVLVSRGPIRSNCNVYHVDPYPARTPINHQVNRQALSGGQVFVASAPENHDTVSQVDPALLLQFQAAPPASNQSETLTDLLDLINKEMPPNFIQNLPDAQAMLEDFQEIYTNEPNLAINILPPEPAPNPIDEFTESHNLPNYEEPIDPNNPLFSFSVPDCNEIGSIYLTPPHSETVPSPLSESQTSFYPPTSVWENSLSPERSSPVYNNDYERYQEIATFEELSPVSENDEQNRPRLNSTSSLTRNNSLSSMNMKAFKDMQKTMGNEFSKKECCQINRKTCKESFDEHMGRLSANERGSMCFNVAKMDVNTAYGVLQNIILHATPGCELLDRKVALFGLVCQRLLAHSPSLFIREPVLNVLKSAVMRCPHLPILTRLFVVYIYDALRNEPAAAKDDCVFHEVDALGDNLIIACARGGDAYALVLAEITRADVRGDLPPLFRVHHANTDGYTALHVACSLHSAGSPRLHVLHVLLEHADADLWKGDVKGGDTALHLAVNSTNCDLRVIMLIFKQVDRKTWRKLAHCHNMSSVTPLEYARSATRSTSRQNYPQEVLDFLKKCR